MITDLSDSEELQQLLSVMRMHKFDLLIGLDDEQRVSVVGIAGLLDLTILIGTLANLALQRVETPHEICACSYCTAVQLMQHIHDVTDYIQLVETMCTAEVFNERPI